MTAPKHVHKLKRHRFKTGNLVYFCVQEECNIKITPALALGKRTICWRCGNEFLMNEYSVRLAKPHCESCHKTKNILLSVEDEVREDLLKQAPAIPSYITDLRSRLQSATKDDEGEI